MDNTAGNIPTTELFPAGDVAMSVIKQSQHNPCGEITRATPWQQYRREDLSQTRVVFGYVIVLCSRRTEEMWLCDMTSSCPDEVLVNNGVYRMILHVCPARGVVIGNSSVDSMGNLLPSHARLFTLLVPVNIPMIYNATLQLVKELEDHTVKCDEIIFSIKTNLAGLGFSRFSHNTNVLDIEYPLPKIKLTGVMKNPFTWSTIMHFEDLADNGQFSLYQRHRKLLERWAKTRPQYQDLVAMILLEARLGGIDIREFKKTTTSMPNKRFIEQNNAFDILVITDREEGVACLIRHKLEEGINLAKRACRLSSYYSCVNDRAIRGYASAVYAAADRFAGNQDGAKEHIVEALEIFEPMEPSTYTSITLYNIGAIIMERSASVGVSEVEEKEAERFLEKAAQHWNHQQQNTTARVLPRIYNRLISLYLKSSPNGAPDLNLAVSQDNLTRAGAIITQYQSLFSQCSNWMNSTFYLCKTDHCIRSRDIDGGLTAAQQALDVSLRSRLARETTGAIQRINLLRELDDFRQRPPELPDGL